MQRWQSWHIGRVKITRVAESDGETPCRAETPFIAEANPDALHAIDFSLPHFVTPEGHLRMAIQALLVAGQWTGAHASSPPVAAKPRPNPPHREVRYAHRLLASSIVQASKRLPWSTHRQ